MQSITILFHGTVNCRFIYFFTGNDVCSWLLRNACGFEKWNEIHVVNIKVSSKIEKVLWYITWILWCKLKWYLVKQFYHTMEKWECVSMVPTDIKRSIIHVIFFISSSFFLFLHFYFTSISLSFFCWFSFYIPLFNAMSCKADIFVTTSIFMQTCLEMGSTIPSPSWHCSESWLRA